jgi:hypothetical protein
VLHSWMGNVAKSSEKVESKLRLLQVSTVQVSD